MENWSVTFAEMGKPKKQTWMGREFRSSLLNAKFEMSFKHLRGDVK